MKADPAFTFGMARTSRTDTYIRAGLRRAKLGLPNGEVSMDARMRRREFVWIAGGAIALPFGAYAQSRLPVVGFLRTTREQPFRHLVAAFKAGLGETGFVEGTSVAIEYRFADHQLHRLPGLAAELIRRPVSVIVANSQAAEAAKSLTSVIPIVFVTGDDPIKRGLIANLARPAGNVTGLSFFGGGALAAKRMELLHELAPNAASVAVLQDPNWPGTAAEMPDIEATARALGKTVVVARAASASEFEAAFATIAKADPGALVVIGSPTFTGNRAALVALVARHRLPAIYDLRENAEAGGLISFSGSIADAYRQAGVYAGRILNGAKPAELPVLLPSKFELVVNLRTAKALGITVPQSIVIRADEVIE